MTKRKTKKKPKKREEKKRDRFKAFLHSLRTFLLKKETCYLIGIFLIAAFFRFYNFFDLGLTHFDEGPYVQVGTILDKKPGAFYEASLSICQFSPPLLPFMIGITFKLFGLHDFIALLPSLLCGILTCVAVFYLGKIADNLQTGIWGALFLAINEFHIIYSRLALTDIILTFFFTVTVLLGVMAWKKNRWWLYSLVGVSSGLAMNTKYNGFVPFLLVIGYYVVAFMMEYVLNPLIHKKDRHTPQIPLKRRLVHLPAGLAAALLLFVLLYSHWYINVDKTFGYAKLMEHHKGYSYPLKKGLERFFKKPGEMFVYFKLWSALPFFLLIPGLLASIWRWNKRFVILYAWLVFYYFALFVYFRYTRLALPIIPPLCILAAAGVSRIFLLLERIVLKKPRVTHYITVAAVCILVIFSYFGLRPTLALDTNSYRLLYREVREKVKPPAVIFIDTLRNFNFYMDIPHIRLNTGARTQEILKSPVNKYFAVDMHITWSKNEDFLKVNKDRLRTIAVIPNRQYEPIWLEPFSYSQLLKMRKNPENYPEQFNLYLYQTDQPCAIPDSWK